MLRHQAPAADAGQSARCFRHASPSTRAPTQSAHARFCSSTAFAAWWNPMIPSSPPPYLPCNHVLDQNSGGHTLAATLNPKKHQCSTPISSCTSGYLLKPAAVTPLPRDQPPGKGSSAPIVSGGHGTTAVPHPVCRHSSRFNSGIAEITYTSTMRQSSHLSGRRLLSSFE